MSDISSFHNSEQKNSQIILSFNKVHRIQFLSVSPRLLNHIINLVDNNFQLFSTCVFKTTIHLHVGASSFRFPALRHVTSATDSMWFSSQTTSHISLTNIISPSMQPLSLNPPLSIWSQVAEIQIESLLFKCKS